VPAPRPAPLAFPHPGPPLVHDVGGRDEGTRRDLCHAPCPSPAGTGPAGLLTAGCWSCSGQPRKENAPWEETLFRGQAKPGEARRGEARRRRLRFQGVNGENSKEPRLVRGLGVNELYLPRDFIPGAAQKPFSHRDPDEHRTSLPCPAPRVPSPQGMGKGRNRDLGCTNRLVCMRRAPAGGRGGGMQGGRDGGPALAPRRPPLLPPEREGGASPRRSRGVTWNPPPEREGGASPRRSPAPGPRESQRQSAAPSQLPSSDSS
jgi:hypothetical protein